MTRLVAAAVQLAVLVIALAAALASSSAASTAASWPARTDIAATTGPVPHGKGWKQCAQLKIENPSGMVAGRWAGTLQLDGGTLAFFRGAALVALDDGSYSVSQPEDLPALKAGAAHVAEICVAYEKKWAATASIQVKPAVEDKDKLFVQVQTDPSTGQTTRMLMKRQSGVQFAPSFASGTCQCLPVGVSSPPSAPPPPPPPPPPSVVASTTRPAAPPAATPTPILIAYENFDYDNWELNQNGGAGWAADWYQTSINFDRLDVLNEHFEYTDNGDLIRASGRQLANTVSPALCSKAWVAFKVQYGTQNGYGTPTFRLLNSTQNYAVLAVGNNGYEGPYYGLLTYGLFNGSITRVPLDSLQNVLVEIDFPAKQSRMWLDANTPWDVKVALPTTAPSASVSEVPNQVIGIDVLARGMPILDDIRFHCLPVGGSVPAPAEVTMTTRTTQTRTTLTTTTTPIPGAPGVPTLVSSEEFTDYGGAQATFITNRNGGTGWNGPWYKSDPTADALTLMNGYLYKGLPGNTTLRASGRMMDYNISATSNSKAWVSYNINIGGVQNGAGSPQFRLLKDIGVPVMAIGNDNYTGAYHGLLYGSSGYPLTNRNISTYSLRTQVWMLLEIDYDANETRLWIDPYSLYDPTNPDYGMPDYEPTLTVPFAPAFAGIDIYMRNLRSISRVKIYRLPR